MDLKHHFELMALYNQRMNRQVYQAAEKLSADDYNKNLGAFFVSVQGTLNHILVGDLNWLRRFEKHSDSYHSLQQLVGFPVAKSLKDILYSDLSQLKSARETLDNIIISWASNDLSNSNLSGKLCYKNAKGEQNTRNFAELIHHLFNHQTHHRGQLSTLFSQLGLDVGGTDFLMDIPSD